MNPQLTRRRVLRHGICAIGAGAGCAGLLSNAHARVFMDLEQAKQALLPDAQSFAEVPLQFDDALLQKLARDSGTRVPRGFAPRCWSGARAGHAIGWVFFDRVVGKYDLIDYAVGFDTNCAIIGVEVLAYRESHGYEVRNDGWRRQFVGRKNPQSIRFEDEIRNISGATLSCHHMTEGVQRLVVLATIQAQRATG